MFNLEGWIANWRQTLLAQETLLAEEVDELEDHLRLEVARQVEGGLAEEAACLAAARRLGQAQDLAQEFGKVNGHAVWAQRLVWMIVGLLLIPLWNRACEVVPSVLAVLAWQVTRWDGIRDWMVYGPVAVAALLSIGAVALLLNAPRRWRWLTPLFQWARRRPVLSVVLLIGVWTIPQLLGQWGNFVVATQVIRNGVQGGEGWLNTGTLNLLVGLALPTFWGIMLLWLNRQSAAKIQTPLEFAEADGRVQGVRRLRWAIAGYLLLTLWEAICVLCARLAGLTAMQFWRSAGLGGVVYGIVILGAPLGMGLAVAWCLNTLPLRQWATLPAAQSQQVWVAALLALLIGLRLFNNFVLGPTFAQQLGASFYGEFLLGRYVINLGEALLVPIFWAWLLLWLNRQRKARFA